MDQMRMLKIVEQYSTLGEMVDEEIKITRVPDWKTVYVEQSDGMGRAIIMTEYKVNGKTFWAGYSPRSQTVYVSRA